MKNIIITIKINIGHKILIIPALIIKNMIKVINNKLIKNNNHIYIFYLLYILLIVLY
jgi:hypothetical protein